MRYTAGKNGEVEPVIRIFHKAASVARVYFLGQLLVLGNTDLLLYGYVPSIPLILWNLLHLLNLYYRFVLTRDRLSNPDNEEVSDLTRHFRHYFFSLLFSGILWGSVVLFMRHIPESSYFIIYSMIIIMTFASTTTIGPISRYFFAFTLPMNLAVIVDLFLYGDEIHSIAALTLSVAFYFSIRSSLIHQEIYARILKDEQEADRMRRHFERLAGTDNLTGLPNRHRFLQVFDETLKEARTEGRRCILFFLDLDRFKEINDTYGHHAGDTVLRYIAARLTREVADRGVAARLAGDEFVVLIHRMDEGEDEERLAERIRKRLEQPISIDGESITPRISLGIVCFPDDGHDPDELLRCADLSMYRSKESGRPERYRRPKEETKVSTPKT